MPALEHSYFLRTVTAEGAVSFLSELFVSGAEQERMRVVYLRSGQGGAATQVLKTIAAAAETHEAPAELFWDAPGKEQLCALRLPEQHLCYLEVEEPWRQEVSLPGAGEELFSLDCCRDNAQLRQQRGELQALRGAFQRELQRAGRFLHAAGAVKRDMTSVVSQGVDPKKLESFASRFAAKYFPKPQGVVGVETHRFLTAVTGQGLVLRRSGLEHFFSRNFVFDDEYAVATPQIFSLLRAYALGNGVDVVNCRCPLAPFDVPEHLLFPSLGLALYTSNRRHPVMLQDAQHIQSARFLAKNILSEHQYRLHFCKRTMRELLAEAYHAKLEAERCHTRADEIYEKATSKSLLRKATRAISPFPTQKQTQKKGVSAS